MKATDQEQADRDEEHWTRGHRAAWHRILSLVLAELYHPVEKGWALEVAALINERESAIAVLRQICEEHGDNDWDENLRLADIIEKHLGKYLDT